MFSESELALQESVATFAKEVIGPKVSEMDSKGEFDPEILKGCFEQGIMGIEAPEEFGGVGLGFTAACIAVEEIARVDPSVAVMIDIHNTLNVASLMKYGTDKQKELYLPRLCKDTVSRCAHAPLISTASQVSPRPQCLPQLLPVGGR
jgi:alkylation response protein AidB-like acyl-CoA dehydrogenase